MVNRNYSHSVYGSTLQTEKTTGEWEACNATERPVEMDAISKKREKWKAVEGTCGDKKKTFDPKRVAHDGKLHHGAFVLGVRKSQECIYHNKESEIQVTDRCKFAHGWRGDTLQHVCTKCTNENLTYCKEKTKHEPFIYNLGPYYNSSGEIWKDRKTFR